MQPLFVPKPASHARPRSSRASRKEGLSCLPCIRGGWVSAAAAQRWFRRVHTQRDDEVKVLVLRHSTAGARHFRLQWPRQAYVIGTQSPPRDDVDPVLLSPASRSMMITTRTGARRHRHQHRAALVRREDASALTPWSICVLSVFQKTLCRRITASAAAAAACRSSRLPVGPVSAFLVGRRAARVRKKAD